MSKTIVTDSEPDAKTRKQLVIERQLGWLVYAEGMPATVCGTLPMVAGWIQANRDEAAAMMTTAELLISIDDTLALIKTLPRRRVKILVVPPAPIDEFFAMHADADELERGERAASFRLTACQVEEMEQERVGAELCEAPYSW